MADTSSAPSRPMARAERVCQHLLKMNATASSSPATENQTESHDALRIQAGELVPSRVVVVGGGLAGLCATIEALRNGAIVTLLDKEQLGGNSAKATSGINAVNTPAQIASAIQDSLELFQADTVKSAKYTGQKEPPPLMEVQTEQNCKPGLQRVLAKESLRAYEFLTSFGCDLSVLSQCGGHSRPRTHRSKPRADGSPTPIGHHIISQLIKYLTTVPPSRLRVITRARALRIVQLDRRPTDSSADKPASAAGEHAPRARSIMEDTNRVAGVEYLNAHGDLAIAACDAVILATGGFAASQTLLSEYCPRLAGLPTTNGQFAQGDGVLIGQQIGAAMMGVDKVQVHPTAFIMPDHPTARTKFLAPEAMRAVGGLLLNDEGRRFCNELGLRDYVTSRILQHCVKMPATRVPDEMDTRLQTGPVRSFLIFSEAAARAFGMPEMSFYMKKNLVRRYANLSALCSAERLPEASVWRTFKEHTQAAGRGVDEFGKRLFPMVLGPNELAAPMYAAWVTPALHYTMGGLSINSVAEVQWPASSHAKLWGTSKSICGVYAAGEVTGAVHGSNRLAGNSLLECVVFGRIAGRKAGQINRHVLKPLDQKEWRPLPLRARFEVVPKKIKILRFDLPSSSHRLGYYCAEYISVRAVVDGKQLVRYYSPISRYDDPGYIDLLVKVDENGAMSHHLDRMDIGDTLDFRGPFGKLNLDLALLRPGDWMKQGGRVVRKLGLIAGGVGVSPMVQIIRTLLFHNRNDISVILLYAAETEDELCFKSDLQNLTMRKPNIKVFYVLNKPSPGWQGLSGMINQRVLKTFMHAPAPDVQIVICGGPKMCRAIKGTLVGPLRHNPETVFSYL